MVNRFIAFHSLFLFLPPLSLFHSFVVSGSHDCPLHTKNLSPPVFFSLLQSHSHWDSISGKKRNQSRQVMHLECLSVFGQLLCSCGFSLSLRLFLFPSSDQRVNWEIAWDKDKARIQEQIKKKRQHRRYRCNHCIVRSEANECHKKGKEMSFEMRKRRLQLSTVFSNLQEFQMQFQCRKTLSQDLSQDLSQELSQESLLSLTGVLSASVNPWGNSKTRIPSSSCTGIKMQCSFAVFPVIHSHFLSLTFIWNRFALVSLNWREKERKSEGHDTERYRETDSTHHADHDSFPSGSNNCVSVNLYVWVCLWVSVCDCQVFLSSWVKS